EVLCSYNWHVCGKMIFVPGAPPKWTPVALPTTLKKDSGYRFVEQNGFRVPKYSFEPAFQALGIMNPGTKVDNIDIFANRNSFRKLLHIVSGRRFDPFCMDLQMVKGTLFISRKEQDARTMIYGSLNSGYGHSLEDTFTTPEEGLDHSSSHHRVIRYHMGNLNCAVRFEVDAYYEPYDGGVAVPEPAPSQMKFETYEYASTQVIRKGTLVSSSALAEIKAKKSHQVSQTMPQLWFGRTPYLLTGHNVDGVVHKISCTHAALEFRDWEKKNQETLRKLVGLLEMIIDVVKKTEKRAAVLVCEQKGGPIRILEKVNVAGVLSEEMCEEFWDEKVGATSVG
ncbi:hypothetical protein GQ43DRAFT_384216, partial [Delitschia confertaspora ATCC 74209]